MKQKTTQKYEKMDDQQRLQLLNDLVESQRFGRAVADFKGNFLSKISHELYTPMNSVLGFINLKLEDYELSDNHKHMLKIARKCGNTLLQQVNTLIDVSNIEKGILQIDNKVFNLPSLLHETLPFLDIKAKHKALFLNTDLEESCRKNYVGDPKRISQILTILIDNAIKYTEIGGVTVEISLEKTDKDTLTDTLIICVSDSGIGIAEEHLQEIFEPFHQLDESTERPYGGIGLSTSLTKQLVELMNGKFWVESSLGKGSEFYVQLDLPVCEEQVFDCKLEEDEEVDIVRNYRVLVVDDMELNLDLLKLRLEELGHYAETVLDGKPAIEAFEKDSYDAIFMDVHMNEMNGLEATKRIRAIEKEQGIHVEQHIPIIGLTGSVDPEDIDNCIRVGMDSVVSKPIDFDLLFSTMEQLVPEKIREKKMKNTSANSKPAMSKLPKLPGIDSKQALITWRDPEIYTKALIKFSVDYQDISDKIAQLHKEKNLDDIRHIAHTLQGLSGNLSMTNVYPVIMQINSAAKGNELAKIKKLLKPLRESIKEISTSVRLLTKNYPQNKGTIKKRGGSKKTLKKNLQSLINSCQLSDPDDAEQYFNQIREHASPKTYHILTDCFDRFDFDGAIVELVEMAADFNIRLKQ